jgi:hypothetical protein
MGWTGEKGAAVYVGQNATILEKLPTGSVGNF